MMQRPMVHIKNMEAANIVKDVYTTSTNQVIVFKEDVAHKTTGIGAESVVAEPKVILHITVGHTECVLIREKTTGPQQACTRRTRCGVTRCWELKEIAPDRLGQYMLEKLMWKIKPSNTYELLCISIVDSPQHVTVIEKADNGASNVY